MVRRITHELMSAVGGTFEAVVEAAEPGVVAGIGQATPPAAGEPMGQWTALADDGDELPTGAPLLRVRGRALELMLASDHAMGVLGFAGGVAARARRLRAEAPSGLALVCGGWKKLPAALKPALRAALDVAGLGHRLVEGPFVYIDKNAARLLGGMTAAVGRGLDLGHGPVSIQVTDVQEAVAAVRAGAGVVMVDTGSVDDLREVDRALREFGCRHQVRLAFGGGIEAGQLAAIHGSGADIADIGRAVLDAPLWDLRFRAL
jgi:nicotinate-nucleotide pyrophosphorylase (carboxylating)